MGTPVFEDGAHADALLLAGQRLPTKRLLKEAAAALAPLKAISVRTPTPVRMYIAVNMGTVELADPRRAKSKLPSALKKAFRESHGGHLDGSLARSMAFLLTTIRIRRRKVVRLSDIFSGLHRP